MEVGKAAKVRLSLSFVKNHIMKTKGELSGQLHATAAVPPGEWRYGTLGWSGLCSEMKHLRLRRESNRIESNRPDVRLHAPTHGPSKQMHQA
jgi:hypothetical protein